MTNAKERDLTVGSPMRLLVAFMLPQIFGLLFQQLYSMVDTFVVGRYLGMQALAGVGSTGAVTFLILGMCNGVCAGFAIPVAMKFGQHDEDGLRKFVGNMIWLGSAFALVATLLTALLCRDILVWMKTPEDTFAYAYEYVLIIFIGIPTIMLYNLLSGIIRSLGDARTPILFLLISSALNVVLDFALILALHMGVAGAALATVLSQLISGLLCLLYMAKHFPVLRLQKDDWKMEPDKMRYLLSMGLPMGLQYSITAIGSILLQIAINGLGSVVMAAITAANKVVSVFVCPYDAMGAAVATYAGQNLGAGRPDRIHRGTIDCAIMGIVWAELAFAALYLWGEPLTVLFLDTKDTASIAQILPLARDFIRITAAFFIPLLFVYLLRLTIQSIGYSNIAVASGIMEMLARGIASLCFVPLLGFQAVCLAGPAAWLMADVFLFPAYFHCMKKCGWTPKKKEPTRRLVREKT